MQGPDKGAGQHSRIGVVVAALSLALVGWSVLHNGAGAANDQRQARHVIGTDADRMTGPGRTTVEHYDATHPR